MTAGLQHYRVSLVTWDTWEIWLDAASQEAAEAEAERMFSEDGEDAFRHRGCGIDCVEAEGDDAEGGDQ